MNDVVILSLARKYTDNKLNSFFGENDGFVDLSQYYTKKEVDNKIKKIAITPQMFGAKADGITDDTVAFKEAVKEACSQGVVLNLVKGTYLITEPINIDHPLQITGGGVEVSTILWKGTIHETSQYDEEYWEEANAAIRVRSNNVVLENFKVTSGATTRAEAIAANGIIFHYPVVYSNGVHGYECCQRIDIKNIDVNGFKDGIYICGGWNRYITNTQVTLCSRGGFTFEALEKHRLGNYCSSGDVIIACQTVNNGYGIYAEYTYETFFQNVVMEYNTFPIKSVGNKDINFKNCWNEANYNNIIVEGNARFEGGFNISNVTVEHIPINTSDVIVFLVNGDTLIYRGRTSIYKQIGGVVVKGVNIGVELENLIINPYFTENAGGSFQIPSSSGWTLYPNSDYCKVSTSILYNEHNSALVSVPKIDTIEDLDYGFRTIPIIIDSGSSYTFSFVAKVNNFVDINAKGGGKIFVAWLNSSDVILKHENQKFNFMSNQWEDKSFTITQYGEATKVIIGFGLPKDGDIYFSEPQLINNNSTISSDVSVKQANDGNVVQFLDSTGQKLGAIDLDVNKDYGTLFEDINNTKEGISALKETIAGGEHIITITSDTPYIMSGNNIKTMNYKLYGKTELINGEFKHSLNPYIKSSNANIFDISQYENNIEDYMGYMGYKIPDVQPNTKYTCQLVYANTKQPVTSGNTVYFGQSLDLACEQNNGYFTSSSDSNGNLYIWILRDRVNYNPIMNGEMIVQVAASAAPLQNVVPYASKITKFEGISLKSIGDTYDYIQDGILHKNIGEFIYDGSQELPSEYIMNTINLDIGTIILYKLPKEILTSISSNSTIELITSEEDIINITTNTYKTHLSYIAGGINDILKQLSDRLKIIENKLNI